MPRKKDEPPKDNSVIVQRSMEEILHESMLPYAEHVILERALPRVEDGLKPVQRRILYTMQEMAVTPDKPHRKSARIVGDCMGKYHPHGDGSVYDAMVRMAQPFNLRAPLVDGHGNFGSIDGDVPAAMRYTEARMAALALELLRDIDQDTVDFSLNFDDSIKEPDLLPAHFPNLLVNGASGIAVGLATNIPPHNLGETIKAVIAQIDDPDIPLDALMQHVPGPDFPTGGILLHTPELRAAYETGRGRLQVRAKVDIEREKSGKQLLVITEVPYQVNKATMLEKILKLSEEKKGPLAAISDIRDESDREGLRAVIELRKDADAQLVLAYLYKYSDLQVTFGVNIVAIAQGRPQQLGLKQAIAYYIQHQRDVLTRRTRHELENAKRRAHILEGLMRALDDLDRAIAIIRASKDGPTARAGLMEAFDLSDVQAQAILDLRLQRLTGLEIEALREEHAKLQKRIAELEAILSDGKKLMRLIKKELTSVMERFADPRRTEIRKEEAEIALPDVSKMNQAPAEETCVLLTRGGFLKRLPSKQVDKALEHPDAAQLLVRTFTDQKLLFFTDRGNVFTLPADAIAECRPQDRGALPASLLEGLEEGEAILNLLQASAQGEDEVLFVTRRGMVKRTALKEYGARRGKLAAINLKAGDALLLAEMLKQEHNLLLLTHKGMSIHFSLDEVPVTGRATGGVKGISLDASDMVASAMQILPEGEILLMTERGYGKRNLVVDHDPQGRGGKGLKAFQFAARGANGSRIIGAIWVRDPVDVDVEQVDGTITTLNSEEVLLEPRFSKGKPYVMALMDNEVLRLCIRVTADMVDGE